MDEGVSPLTWSFAGVNVDAVDAQVEQARYYTATAQAYDEAHLRAGDEHFVALEYMSALFRTLQVSSVLDIGSGTGRACEFHASRNPALQVVGVEPVAALLEASRTNSALTYVQGSGEKLPFAHRSFDAVCATAVLHHVPNPGTVVAEMMRVARRVVVISDSNRFGQGSLLARILKLALFRVGLWPLLNSLRTGGKGYLWSEGDGVFYSYSVYDSLTSLSQWADRVVLIGTGGDRIGWTGPLLTSSSVMLAAIREPQEGFAVPMMGRAARS